MMHVLIMGNPDRAEMQPIVHWLRERAPGKACRQVAGIASAEETIRAGLHPDLIVAFESHPDEFTSVDVNRLFAAAPLARIVCCAGTWSESASRTRKHWPLALRVPAISALPRLEREWAGLSHESTARFLPATGSREEWFAAHHPPFERNERMTGVCVRLNSPDAAYRDMLYALFLTAGGIVAEAEDQPADVEVWDVDPWQPDRRLALNRKAAVVPVIAVSDWITPELEAELRGAGVRAILPKLGDVRQLLERL